MNAKSTVLIVDDEAFVRESLQDVLAGEGFQVVAAGDVPAALRAIDTQAIQAVVTDLQMPGGGGLALLSALRERSLTLPVIVITGVGTISHAVEAMKAGAWDFVQKPVDAGQLVLQLQRALSHQRLLSDVRFLRAAAQPKANEAALVGDSPALCRVRELVAQVAPTDTTVLITGESGSGKELVAGMIHRASRRAERHFVRVNCAAIPEGLFDSEFFGHRRGALPGATVDRDGRLAEAEGGTLVLDEVGALRTEMQGKLLRALESGEYQVAGESRRRRADVRVIAITNEPISARVRDGTFRADLYYRLAVFPIDVPPLRQHKEDLAAISTDCLERLSESGSGRGPLNVPAAALEILRSYDWPGNVRELRNVLERARILAGKRPLDAALLRSVLESSLHSPSATGQDLHMRTRLDAAERELLLAALTRAEGRKKDAAALLGIDPRNLGYYLKKHDLSGG
ncbi:MAG: sigma-54-dependent transcriptional regulator [Planctomycetota bacterium]